MGYWQVSAGYGGESGGGRDYSDVFLDFGVMLIGPGEYGEYFENAHRYEQEKDGRRVRWLIEEVKPDDVVALKRPAGRQWEILAVGIVKSYYIWLPMFDDVEGWDIRHGRRVEWMIPADAPKKIGGFTWGTLNKVCKAETIEAIDRIRGTERRRESRDVPPSAEKLTDEGLICSLIDYGVRAEDAERIVQAIQRIRGLAEWYRDLVRNGVKVKEHETRTFLIVPLLLALGWREPKLKI